VRAFSPLEMLRRYRARNVIAGVAIVLSTVGVIFASPESGWFCGFGAAEKYSTAEFKKMPVAKDVIVGNCPAYEHSSLCALRSVEVFRSEGARTWERLGLSWSNHHVIMNALIGYRRFITPNVCNWIDCFGCSVICNFDEYKPSIIAGKLLRIRIFDVNVRSLVGPHSFVGLSQRAVLQSEDGTSEAADNNQPPAPLSIIWVPTWSDGICPSGSRFFRPCGSGSPFWSALKELA
jgi:hypothetical protein